MYIHIYLHIHIRTGIRIRIRILILTYIYIYVICIIFQHFPRCFRFALPSRLVLVGCSPAKARPWGQVYKATMNGSLGKSMGLGIPFLWFVTMENRWTSPIYIGSTVEEKSVGIGFLPSTVSWFAYEKCWLVLSFMAHQVSRWQWRCSVLTWLHLKRVKLSAGISWEMGFLGKINRILLVYIYIDRYTHTDRYIYIYI